MKLKIFMFVLIVLLIIAPVVFATINVCTNLKKPVSTIESETSFDTGQEEIINETESDIND